MTKPPVYVERIQRITQALGLLTLHPDGLPISRLAEMLDVDEKVLRQSLLAYYRADIDPKYGEIAYRQVRIGFFGPRGDEDVEPAEAEIVRAFVAQPATEVGVTYASIGELAQIYKAGRDLLTDEPDNAVLESALTTLSKTTLAGLEPPQSYWVSDLPAMLRAAIDSRRRVRITYVPVWRSSAARDYVLEPHRLISTRRGWEVDAGVEGRDGRVRVLSFLLSGVRSAEPLDDTFERPPDVDAQIAENRRERPVDLLVPQNARWAVDRLAESVDVLQEDEDSVNLRANLLPPVGERLALIMLIAGPAAFVVAPPDLVDAGSDHARLLLAHHETL
ncbi:MAG TPA: WYL domain-containing protein [Jiangellaceae bacterium]|nr:WYL domain-containing protein [Jiangellaceae bacterium]